MGQMAIQLAKARGAWVATTCSTRSAPFVTQFAPDRIVDYTKVRTRYMYCWFITVAFRSLADAATLSCTQNLLQCCPPSHPTPPSAGELVGAQGSQRRRRVRHGGVRRPSRQGQGVPSFNHLVLCCSPQPLQGILPADGAVVSIASWDFGVDPNGHPPLRHAAAFVLTNSTSIQVWVPQH